MRLTQLPFGMAVAVALAVLPVRAQDETALPDVHELGCVGPCASYTRAVGLTSGMALYSSQDDIDDNVEAEVLLLYVVKADGQVGDVTVLRLIGSQKFAERSINAVRRRKYKPATLNGQPVDSATTVEEIFRIDGLKGGARDETVSDYDDAVSALNKGNADGALAKLTQTLSEPDLDFYEREILSYLASKILMDKGDFLQAQYLLKRYSVVATDELDVDTLQKMLRLRIAASLEVGDVVDVDDALDDLKKTKGFAADDPIMNTVQAASARLDGLPVFEATQKIPPATEGTGVGFSLYRRNFGFANIAGSLESFRMVCNQQTIESVITDKAEWHVPNDWNCCSLYVRGKPGTTFNIVQSTQ